jgi:sec-independent protein translocase protein TatC
VTPGGQERLFRPLLAGYGRMRGMTAALARIYEPPPDEQPPSESGAMSFLDHLEELRARLIRCCIAIAVGMTGAFFYITPLVSFVLTPTLRALPAGGRLIYTQPTEAFSLYMQVAMIAGTLAVSPVITYQVWRFIAPGLLVSEKRLAIPFVLLTTAGAVGGAAFGHYVVFPYMIAFFGTFSSPDLAFLPRLEEVFGLYVRMLVGMAIVFQIPTIVFFLARFGLITARWLWRNLQYAVLAIVVVAAVVTPSSDPWNLMVLATPMIGLYLLSIGIAYLVAGRGGDAADQQG